ncbi:MAG TPA: hypothetical protein VGV90_16725, partial [Solirubrobacteraceae bacterium]|nr:hypothetical protein [Solirubrobacteraceae bacterium]
ELKASDPASALRTLHGVKPRTTVGRLAEALTSAPPRRSASTPMPTPPQRKPTRPTASAIELGEPGSILDATWAHALAAHAEGELPIIAFADGLADEAQRLGAARGHAFALTLRGEAMLLAGRLREADGDFAEGARLHSAIGASAGEALSLLGRAQVANYRNRPGHARPYLMDALLMARESEVGHHTLDRIYGAMVEAAGDPAGGLKLVREAASAVRGPAETCPTCRIAFIVPAAIAAAQAGDLQRAGRYEQACDAALEVIALPPAWHAAVAEVHGHVARADGRADEARSHLQRAADGFRTWGQPLDAQAAPHSPVARERFGNARRRRCPPSSPVAGGRRDTTTTRRSPMRCIPREDVPVAIADGGVEVRVVDQEGLMVGFVSLPAGADCGPPPSGYPTTCAPARTGDTCSKAACACTPPTATRISRRATPSNWAPGHAPEALEDSEYVDFSPTHEFQRVLDHLTGAAAPADA